LVNPNISPDAGSDCRSPRGLSGHEYNPKYHSGGPEVEGYLVCWRVESAGAAQGAVAPLVKHTPAGLFPSEAGHEDLPEDFFAH
jgi:hypothetical protein